jgi:hypothetical protein
MTLARPLRRKMHSGDVGAFRIWRNMKRRYTVAFLLGALAIARSPMPTHAACAALTLSEDFKRSTAVIVGRAVAQSVATTPTLTWPRATETTFDVEQVWKGPVDKSLQIRTCGGTVGREEMICNEAFLFVVGSRYVVFGEGQPLVTSACRHTELMSTAEETLTWLSSKPLKRRRSLIPQRHDEDGRAERAFADPFNDSTHYIWAAPAFIALIDP